MTNPWNHPVVVLVATLFIFWFSAWVGGWLRRSWPILKEDDSDDLKFVIGGMLTLLALIIGFTFSMAVIRYYLRKSDEEQEANAVGTALIRANQLSAADGAKIQALLKSYVDQRILFYVTSNEQDLRQINAGTVQLQTEIWSVTSSSVTGLPAPMAIFVLGAMNDVLNSQGYTQAAWRNRIPKGAWILMVLISILCNLLIGYGAPGRSPVILIVLPITLSISLFLIADIDSPRHGVIRVRPQNLDAIAESLHSQ